MLQNVKPFPERLNHCLDDSEAPTHIRERTAILSKMLDISKQQAFSLLAGQQTPDLALLQKIANEFEVDPHWLIGEK